MTRAAAPRPFELVPRRRFAGTPFGRHRSARRGQGDEVAGTRPYRPGDNPGHIDWPASARLSAARGNDEFVVREFYADEAPAVAIVRDLRPGMTIHAAPSPWLDKAAAADAVVALVGASAAEERAAVVHADARDTSERSLRLAVESVLRRAAALPTGSFVFVVSDFLVDLPAATWLRLRALAWDVVPVVVQDPLWEQTFPQVGGVVLPIADPVTGDVEDLWITTRAARGRAAANEERLERILARFRRLGFDPVLVGTSDPFEISSRFQVWASRRRLLRNGRR